MSHPESPDWEAVPEAVLVALIEDYNMEQACATTAIIYLRFANPSRARQLALWLLSTPDADRWLKEAATEALEIE